MGRKIDQDTTASIKLLRIFRKLLLNGRKHYQNELADEFQCSAQTVIRIMADIESVIGTGLESGLENRRKWYRIRPKNAPDSAFEEVRYLSICRDLAADSLPPRDLARIDDTIYNLDTHLARHRIPPARSAPAIHFLNKGRIDYSSRFADIEKLIEAIEKRAICLLRYREDGKTRACRFAPACLLSLEGELYLAGAALERQPFLINIGVHHILDIELTDEHFSIDFPDFSGNMFGLPWHEPRTFQIMFKAGKTAEYVAERIWSDSQIMTWQPDGSLLLEIATRSEGELRMWIRSFGEEARLLD